MFKNLFNALRNALAALRRLLTFGSRKAGSPDENPKRRYDLNWKLTGYFNNADHPAISADYDRLAKEEGDGNTITCFNTDKDWQCKMGGCHDPGTEIIERPGWEDENRTVASRKGPPHLTHAERKAWYDEVKAKHS
ncbi:MAG: hypothetical protein K2Y22_15205 [Candidatus Obscuribacterales bacterium]|nr:hypothetical protein [Candidatus Obscuribacterales bacterium]